MKGVCSVFIDSYPRGVKEQANLDSLVWVVGRALVKWVGGGALG